jgi:error-prone DNA polymerase
MEFVHLHTHSPFSFLDGASSIEDLVEQAAQLDMPALAITDHNNVCAAVKFHQLASRAGIKPIQGIEADLPGGYHLTLIARNARGYASLCRLLTHGHLSHPRGNPCLDPSWMADMEDILVLSGCRQGKIPALILKGHYQEAVECARYYRDILGRENFYIELQDTLLPGNQRLNHRLMQLADSLDVEPVATNNVHYADRQDFMVHDLLICVNHLLQVNDVHPARPLNAEQYLKSGAAMEERFHFCPRALANTAVIAEQCQGVLGGSQMHFPRFASPPGGSAIAYLRSLSYAGARERYGRITPLVQQRLDYELGIIEQMGFADYFLLVWDLAQFARRQGIRYAGRGSAADSLVSYCLFICDVDALQRGLLFERFMSPERSQMPDIDIDFEARYRDRVIDYVYKTYGAQRVARVATYNTFKARSAVRDIGKVLGFAEEELSRIAKSLPHTYADRIRGVLDHLPELQDSPLKEQRFQLLLDVCEHIAGFPRFLGTHLGGLVISDVPLTNFTPLQRSALGPVITQFDKDDIEALGLVKLDLLSLRTLSVVQDAVQQIQEAGAPLDYDHIDLDDEATYDMISQGETIGVFQLESPAQRALQTRLGASHMEDIVASMALIRPGPIKGNMVDPYIRRRQGQEEITYLHPLLKPILEKTYGVILFQEQVIEIAIAVAGFTPGEADQLRRVMTHARSQRVMEEIGQHFVQKAVQNGIDAGVAQSIFACMVGYASYGFCEAHAAAFASTSYKTAYLIKHYPSRYFAALLNHQPMGYYPPHVIAAEARRRGIKLLPADVNQSQIDCKADSPVSIRIGLKLIKGISRSTLNAIHREQELGLFSSAADFIKRIAPPRDEAENIVKCGALDSLYPNRRELLSILPYLESADNLLFAGSLPNTDAITDFSLQQKRFMERELLGLDIQEHILAFLRPWLQQRKIMSSQKLRTLDSGRWVQTAGLLIRPHRPPTRSGRITVFFALEDEFGLTDVTMFENAYKRYGGEIFNPPEGVILVRGKLQRRGRGLTIVADQAKRLAIISIKK